MLCCDFKSRDFLWFPSAVRHLKPPSSRVTCVRDSLSCRPLEKNRVRYLVPPRFASRSSDAAALFDSKSYSNLKVNALVDHINFFLSHYCLPNQTWFLSTYLTKVVLPSPKGWGLLLCYDVNVCDCIITCTHLPICMWSDFLDQQFNDVF